DNDSDTSDTIEQDSTLSGDEVDSEPEPVKPQAKRAARSRATAKPVATASSSSSSTTKRAAAKAKVVAVDDEDDDAVIDLTIPVPTVAGLGASPRHRL